MEQPVTNIFFVHSHTTFLSSLGVINRLNIQKQDVVFFILKSYSHPSLNKFIFHDIEFLSKLYTPFSFSRILKLKRSIRRTDEFIADVLKKRKYIAYIPQAMHPLYQIVLTNKLCINYNFIEEGIGNYNLDLYKKRRYDVNFFSSFILDVLNRSQKRIVFNNFFFFHPTKKGETKYFYLNKGGFKYKDLNIEYINWPFLSSEYCIESDVLFVVSPLVEYGLCSIENYFIAIAMLLDKIKVLVGFNVTVAIKFHPHQSEVIQKRIQSTIRNMGLEYKTIENSYSIEQLLVNKVFKYVFGIDSSLLFYASILGTDVNVYSASKKLKLIDSLYRDMSSLTVSMEETLFKNVHQIT